MGPSATWFYKRQLRLQQNWTELKHNDIVKLKVENTTCSASSCGNIIAGFLYRKHKILWRFMTFARLSYALTCERCSTSQASSRINEQKWYYNKGTEYVITSAMNQTVKKPKTIASFDSVSWYGTPMCVHSHNSRFHSSSFHAAEPMSNRATLG